MNLLYTAIHPMFLGEDSRCDPMLEGFPAMARDSNFYIFWMCANFSDTFGRILELADGPPPVYRMFERLPEIYLLSL